MLLVTKIFIMTRLIDLLMTDQTVNAGRVIADCRVKLDLVLIVDSSLSVGKRNFDKVTTFLQSLVEELPVQPDGVRVGAVRYATDTTVITYLDQHMIKSEKVATLKGMPFRPGGTFTHAALELARKSVLAPERGDRPDVPDLIILTTDGVSTNQKMTEKEAAILKENENLKIFVIGIGRNVADSELVSVASRPEMVYKLIDFSQLTNIVKNLAKFSCSDMKDNSILELNVWPDSKLSPISLVSTKPPLTTSSPLTSTTPQALSTTTPPLSSVISSTKLMPHRRPSSPTSRSVVEMFTNKMASSSVAFNSNTTTYDSYTTILTTIETGKNYNTDEGTFLLSEVKGTNGNRIEVVSNKLALAMVTSPKDVDPTSLYASLRKLVTLSSGKPIRTSSSHVTSASSVEDVTSSSNVTSVLSIKAITPSSYITSSTVEDVTSTNIAVALGNNTKDVSHKKTASEARTIEAITSTEPSTPISRQLEFTIVASKFHHNSGNTNNNPNPHGETTMYKLLLDTITSNYESSKNNIIVTNTTQFYKPIVTDKNRFYYTSSQNTTTPNKLKIAHPAHSKLHLSYTAISQSSTTTDANLTYKSNLPNSIPPEANERKLSTFTTDILTKSTPFLIQNAVTSASFFPNDFSNATKQVDFHTVLSTDPTQFGEPIARKPTLPNKDSVTHSNTSIKSNNTNGALANATLAIQSTSTVTDTASNGYFSPRNQNSVTETTLSRNKITLLDIIRKSSIVNSTTPTNFVYKTDAGYHIFTNKISKSSKQTEDKYVSTGSSTSDSSILLTEKGKLKSTASPQSVNTPDNRFTKNIQNRLPSVTTRRASKTVLISDKITSIPKTIKLVDYGTPDKGNGKINNENKTITEDYRNNYGQDSGDLSSQDLYIFVAGGSAAAVIVTALSTFVAVLCRRRKINGSLSEEV